MRRAARLIGAAAVALAALGGAAPAQDTAAAPGPSTGSFRSPILTLDQERLFAETLWGQRARKRIEEASAALAAENRTYEEQLGQEEQALTAKRKTLAPAEFRKEADAFDARVTEIRRTQDAKERGISQVQEEERKRFYAAALPVMGEVLRRNGALVVLDSRAIFLAADAIDVTDEMIAEIDAKLGAGGDDAAPLSIPAPDVGTAGDATAGDGTAGDGTIPDPGPDGVHPPGGGGATEPPAGAGN
ncbi:MAG: OmpH family outer membrane protein [Defluviimonas sp.]|uniref:OmpH family outer membrane protein n=1 Tax=Albidovulum sp. TaxID=1872424 RepID=UPI001DCAE620|nr:OmpH family outer membrane protein [Paracoccaceae bacterium]MCC0063912.1 OmpH family outer membrane protein [Defluviimonas sp.]